MFGPLFALNYILEFVKRIYFAKTEDDSLLEEDTSERAQKNKQRIEGLAATMTEEEKAQLLKAKQMTFSSSNYYKLAIAEYFPCLKSYRETKLYKSYEKGAEQVEKDMDIVRMVRSIKALKAQMQCTCQKEQI